MSPLLTGEGEESPSRHLPDPLITAKKLCGFLSLFLCVIRFTTECDGEAHLVAVSLLPELAEKGTQVIFASENIQCFCL